MHTLFRQLQFAENLSGLAKSTARYRGVYSVRPTQSIRSAWHQRVTSNPSIGNPMTQEDAEQWRSDDHTAGNPQ